MCEFSGSRAQARDDVAALEQKNSTFESRIRDLLDANRKATDETTKVKASVCPCALCCLAILFRFGLSLCKFLYIEAVDDLLPLCSCICPTSTRNTLFLFTRCFAHISSSCPSPLTTSTRIVRGKKKSGDCKRNSKPRWQRLHPLNGKVASAFLFFSSFSFFFSIYFFVFLFLSQGSILHWINNTETWPMQMCASGGFCFVVARC